MLVEKQTDLADKIYSFLQDFVGKENAISAHALCRQFGISDRDLRVVISEIRNNKKYWSVIGSCNLGYYLCKEEEFEKTNRRLKSQAFSLLKTAYANEKKAAKDGQFFLSEKDYCLSVVQAFGQNEEQEEDN